MAQRDVGALTPTTLSSGISSLTWNIYANSDFTWLGWKFVCNSNGLAYTLKLDGVQIATGNTLSAGTTVTFAPQQFIGGTYRVALISWVGSDSWKYWNGGATPMIPGSEVLTVAPATNSYTIASIYTIDSPQTGTTVGAPLPDVFASGPMYAVPTGNGDVPIDTKPPPTTGRLFP